MAAGAGGGCTQRRHTASAPRPARLCPFRWKVRAPGAGKRFRPPASWGPNQNPPHRSHSWRCSLAVWNTACLRGCNCAPVPSTHQLAGAATPPLSLHDFVATTSISQGFGPKRELKTRIWVCSEFPQKNGPGRRMPCKPVLCLWVRQVTSGEGRAVTTLRTPEASGHATCGELG